MLAISFEGSNIIFSKTQLYCLRSATHISTATSGFRLVMYTGIFFTVVKVVEVNTLNYFYNVSIKTGFKNIITGMMSIKKTQVFTE